jgi:hypothetical protein
MSRTVKNKPHPMPPVDSVVLPEGWRAVGVYGGEPTTGVYRLRYDEPMQNVHYSNQNDGLYGEVEWHHVKGEWFGNVSAYVPDGAWRQRHWPFVFSSDINAVIASCASQIVEARAWTSDTGIPSDTVEIDHFGMSVKGRVGLSMFGDKLTIRIDDPRIRQATVHVPIDQVRFITA